MKKIAIICMMAFGSMAFMACSSDDGGSGPECFDCSIMGFTTKYCYTAGDDFYTMEVMGVSEEIPLEGANWNDIKSILQQACN
ncbi:MAG: hypothetical protein WDA08_00140 [Weeksellaceae bacterium]